MMFLTRSFLFAFTAALIALTGCDMKSSRHKIAEELEIDPTLHHFMLPKEIDDYSLSLEKEESQLSILPLARDNPKLKEHFKDIIDSPWLKLQPFVTEINRFIVKDIRLTRYAIQKIEEKRAQQKLPKRSLDDETAALIRTMSNLQASLGPLNFDFPAKYYSFLNIPDTPVSLYPAPLPFKIYKRIYLDNLNDKEAFLSDVRVFDLDTNISKQSQEVIDIVNWHFNKLKAGEGAFTKFASDDCIVMIGRGVGTTQANETGVFLAFVQRENRLFVLVAEAPWAIFDRHQASLKGIVNRPLVEVPKQN